MAVTFQAAEILSVGTELLLGDIVNTDAAFLARELAALGIPCYHQSVVGDNPGRLRGALELALGRSDLIILTGGLGPTCDDLTKETAAAVMGKTLVLHERSYERLKSILSRRNIPESDNQKKQAMLPPDAYVFDNDYGTAPGFAMEDDGGHTMILLPGPPRELEPLFTERVKPYLSLRSGEVFYSVNIGIFGIGEGAVGACLQDLMTRSGNPTVAPYCGEGEVRVRITARGKTEDECRAVCAEYEDIIRHRSCEPYRPGIFDDYVYGTDCDSVAEGAVRLLRAKHLTVSAAESCTGGYLAKRITDVPGASEILSGSFVTYSEATKKQFVGVSDKTLRECSVYSEEVAEEMARGAARVTGADIGVGITGLATGSDVRVYKGKEETLPAGTVFVSCVRGDRVQTVRLHLDPGRRNPIEGREFVRRRAANQALWMIFKMGKED